MLMRKTGLFFKRKWKLELPLSSNSSWIP
jgi:hypothetical protein